MPTQSIFGWAARRTGLTGWTPKIGAAPVSASKRSRKSLAGLAAARDVPHWRSEARLFQAQARRRFVPSMRQRIDVAGLYHDAFRALPENGG